MGLPGFYGRFLEVRKAKSAKKKRGLIRENRRFDPLGPSQMSGPGKKFRGGDRVSNKLTFNHEGVGRF